MEGKTHAIILDHAGNSLRHGLVDAHREWSLDRRERRSRSGPTDVIPVRACLQCTGTYERIYAACPYCGFEAPVAGRSAPEQVDGDLGELDADTLARMRGAVAAVDGAPNPPWGASAEVVGAVRRRHHDRQEAQKELREKLALWGGYRTGAGDTLPQAWRRFYLQFGVDTLTAQSLGAREAGELAERVNMDLQRKGVKV